MPWNRSLTLDAYLAMDKSLSRMDVLDWVMRENSLPDLLLAHQIEHTAEE